MTYSCKNVSYDKKPSKIESSKNHKCTVDGSVSHKGTVDGSLNHNHKGTVDGSLNIKIEGTHAIKSIDHLTSKLTELSSAHGEKVMHTVLDAAHGKAVQDLVVAGIMLMGALLATAVFKKGWALLSGNYERNYEFPGTMMMLSGGVLGAFMLIGSMSTLSNPNLYKSLKNPEIYIAEQVLKRISK